MHGVKLKVAEMGIVATDEKHQGKGLMRLLNNEFNKTLEIEDYDLAVIQGIPGFYHKFGYHYAIPMENHLNVDLELIKDDFDSDKFSVREVQLSDIPFLMLEDDKYRKSNFISVVRDKKQWEYIIRYGKETDYGSDILIFESAKEKFYCRILYQGFGKGIIVSELSETISEEAFKNILFYLKGKAKNENKPFIRFNIENKSDIGKQIILFGAEESKSYAWQLKISNKIGFLKKIKSIIEFRIKQSDFCNLSDILRLDLYKDSIDITFENGKVKSIKEASELEIDNTFCIPEDLFAQLALGDRDWESLQYYRPDIAPMSLYINPEQKPSDDKTGKLISILFPDEKSWIYLQY